MERDDPAKQTRPAPDDGDDRAFAADWSRRAREHEDPAALAADLAELLRDGEGGVRFLTAAVAVAGELLEADACSISMLRGEVALPLASWARDDDVAAELDKATWRYTRVPPAAEAVGCNAPFVIADPQALDLGVAAGLPGVVRRFDSVLFIPFAHAGRVAGVGMALGVRADPAAAGARSDPTLTAAVGAAIALVALEDELERVHEDDSSGLWTGRTAREDVGGRLGRLAQDLVELTGAAACDALRVEPGLLQPVFSFGDTAGDDAAYLDTVFSLDEYPTSALAVERARPAFISLEDREVTQHEREALRLWGYAAQLSLPITLHGEVRLLLELYDTRPRDFGEVAPAAQALCDAAGEALSGALDLEAVLRQGDATRKLVDLAAGASAADDEIALAEGVARQLLSSLEVQTVDVCRVGGERMHYLATADRGGLVSLDACHVDPAGRYPLTVACMASGDPLVVTDPRDSRLSEHERSIFTRFGYQSEVCVPLVVAGETLGFIDVFDTRPRQFGAFVELLGTVGRVVAGTLRRLDLAAESAARETLLNEAVEMATLTAVARDVDVALAEVARRLCLALCADALDITRVDGDALVPLVSVDEEEDEEHEIVPASWSDHLRDYPRTAGAVVRNEIVALRAADEGLSDRERESMSAHGFVGELIVPLHGRERAIGFIDVFVRDERDWSGLLGYVRAASDLVAGIVERADLAERLADANAGLDRLLAAGLEIGSSLELEEVASIAARHLCALTRADSCDICAVGDGRVRVLASSDAGVDDREYVGTSYDLAQAGLQRLAVESREPVACRDVLRDDRASDLDREMARRWGYGSTLDVPLVAGGRVVGCAGLYARAEVEFAHADLFAALGQTVAQAIANATLYRDLARATDRLALVNEIGLELSSTLRPEELLGAACRRVCESIDATGCDVYRIVGDDLEVLSSFADGKDFPDWKGRRFPLAAWRSNQLAVEAGEALVVSDRADERLGDSERTLMAEWGERSLIVAPLQTPFGVIGTLEVTENRCARQFTADEVATVQSVARLTALALRNAELHDGLTTKNRRLDGLLRATGAVSSSVVLEHVLNEVARAAAQMLGTTECLIWEYDPGGRMLMERAYYTEDPRWQDYVLGIVDPLDERPAEARALLGGEPLAERRSDPAVDPVSSAWMEEWSEAARLIVPLRFRDEPIGVLVLVESWDERLFTGEEIEAVQALGEQAAVAIHNARLYKLQQSQNRQKQALLDAGSAISGSLILREVLTTVAATAADALNAGKCVIHTYDRRRRALTTEIAYLRSEDGTRVMREIVPLADYPAGPRLLAEKGPLEERLSDPGIDPASRAAMEECGEKTCLSIPLLAAGDLVGIMVLVETDRERFFSPAEVELARGLGEQAAVAIRNAALYEEIRCMHLANLKGLSTALGAKDYYTLGHAARVAGYTALLVQKLGWPEETVARLQEAAYLHDIGKIGLPESVLLKHGPLTEEEWQAVRRHPELSAEIVGNVLESSLVEAIRHHHERYDGAGYPSSLAGSQISEGAAALALADAYDAMSSRRPYRGPLSFEECRSEIEACAGSQFDPVLATAFLEVLGELRERRERLVAVARDVAARVDVAEHQLLRSRADERRPEYERLVALLREARDAVPGVRFVTTHTMIDKRYVVIGDSEEDGVAKSHIGDEVVADEDVELCMAGDSIGSVVLFADEFGLWLSALAPVVGAGGEVVAVVSVDEPAVESIPVNGLRDEREFVFAAAVEDQALQLTRAEMKASTDGLTGLFNHRYLQERLGQEVERAAHGGGDLSLVFCDLDEFKAFNDLHGHAAGDEALRCVARAVERCIRRVDIAARYGGEEIVVVLTDTGRDAALEVAERIRREVAAASDKEQGRRVTISIGVASYPADASSKAELLDRADLAMYRAKRLGRDRVVAFATDDVVARAVTSPGYERLHDVAGELGARTAHVGAPFSLERLVEELATRLGLDAEARVLCVEAARLHDVGQVGVPDEILQKRERLSPQEWELIREHPRIGARLVAEAGGSGRVAETIAHHHEHWDGGGYPDGLVGQEIPLPARILAVCDAYCAMRSCRPQRGPRTRDQAVAELHRRAGTQFDPQVVTAFDCVCEEARGDAGGVDGEV